MTDWDAALYTQFEAERTRPAADLLAQVHPSPSARIVDLGCGPGNSTALLAARFPDAEIIGLDRSDDMLSSARTRLPRCRFESADIRTWRPTVAPDLIFANASLQWVPDHEALLPRLYDALAPGGTLAVQMPDNRDEPSHAAMRAVAAEEPWSSFIPAAATTRVCLLSQSVYYDVLTPLAAKVDIWRTTYQHPMASAGAIVAWVRATGLRPFLDALTPDRHPAFLARYEAILDAAYPPRADGKRLLAFPRLFIVVRKPR